ncbi:MAG: ATP-binding protein [Candidatus Hodarchaeales archaeon]
MDNNNAHVYDGKSIPTTIRDRIFDHGFSTREGFMGFGLAIVKRLVEPHGWKIILQAIADTTTFQIVIPVVIFGK